MKYPVPILILLALVSACTTTDEIIIDRKGVDMARYEQDLAECRSYSEEVKTGEKVARGAASGAVVGGLIGAITGDAGKAAGVGAVPVKVIQEAQAYVVIDAFLATVFQQSRIKSDLGIGLTDGILKVRAFVNNGVCEIEIVMIVDVKLGPQGMLFEEIAGFQGSVILAEF